MQRKNSSKNKPLPRKIKDFIKRNLKKLKDIDEVPNTEEISHDNYTLWFDS